MASSLYTGIPTVNGVLALDDVGVAIGHVPVRDVAEEGDVLAGAARAEVPAPRVEPVRHAEETEAGEVSRVCRRQERREESRAGLGGAELGEAQHLARDPRVDDRTGKEVDHGADG